MTDKKTNTPVVLCILDGWGISTPASIASGHDAIAAANTPHWDALLARFPHAQLHTSGAHVGLPDGQMGNSEVGHMTIGSGRVILQELPKIDKAIADGTLQQEPALTTLIAALKASGGTCHLAGLASDGGVHAHQSHIIALAQIISEAGIPVAIHAFMDGRDTPPASGKDYMQHLLQAIQPLPHANIATISGRYYAMDRDQRWDRVQLAYDAMVSGKGASAEDALHAIEQSYANDVTDEFILPTVIGNYTGMKDGDALLVANFRADRVREITEAMLNPAFDGFARSKTASLAAAVSMTEYSSRHTAWLSAIYPPEQPKNTLGEVISAAGVAQLRIAETEKYAHVTFFFNGGQETPYTGENRTLVPSPDVATYDLKPEMAAPDVTEKLSKAIASGNYGLIVVNYANTDMVGHTGKLDAAIAAVEAVDNCLGTLWSATEKAGGVLCITADHGNAEQMQDPTTGQPHTAHTTGPVPFVMAEASQKLALAGTDGTLADIAPTLLHLLDIPIPAEMTGKVLCVPADTAE